MHILEIFNDINQEFLEAKLENKLGYAKYDVEINTSLISSYNFGFTDL